MALTDTRNLTWANDKTKFGYKMLQKMGWTEGKGLGVKEDGTTNHIRVRRKTTNAGVGGETSIDAWNKPAKVAEGLNAVLARLAPVNCDTAAVKKERVSKKGRGYYQRRSAGKTVSSYSENELKEIFGGINIDRENEAEKVGKSDEDSEKESEERDSMLNHNVGTTEKVEETSDKRTAKSSRTTDEKARRKNCRKQKGKKANTRSLAVEPTIKKAKKDKKGKKREAR